MTYKEWNAVIMIASTAVIAAWVGVEVLANPAAGVAELAGRLVWAIGISVVVNIAAVIVVTILVSIARREEFKDERADERDASVAARSMRNAYFIASISGLVSLIVLAAGADPQLAVLTLFGGLMLAGIGDSASRLYYYRAG